MDQSTALERALQHDRLLVLAGVVIVVLLAWTYLLAGAGMDMSMVGMAMAAAGLLPPVVGAIAQEVIDLGAVLNALRVALPTKALRDEVV